MWASVAADNGCETQFRANRSVECLRAINGQNLIESTFDKRYKTDVNVVKPYVIYGDQFLPKSPTEMIPDEGSHVLSAIVNAQKYSPTNGHNLTKSEARLELANIFGRFFPALGVDADDVYRLYVQQYADNDYPAIRQAVGRALGDYLTACPTILFARGVAAGGDTNVTQVYQYLWSVKYDSNTWHGSDPGLDVGFMFGDPFRASHATDGVTDGQVLNERRVSLSFMETVAHFARYGNPGPQEGVEWQSYYTTKRMDIINPYFEFTKRIGN
ncbi:unnamed protein product [Medioppia subpectinata]|uniref:Carboxylesterase type B domain-containing protein n=1 Tax=Medioppia subpectinata TaxID=1979941 RepID=A0A7R9L2F0_9ACAR|nr:unnamed protein product [Medioppia subpectinata]CAG2114084.1 unnamed protein product [Medioppia subpectinata]